MRKTSIYLDDRLIEGVAEVGRRTGRSQSEIIRSGIGRELEACLATRPKMRTKPVDLGGLTQEDIDAILDAALG
ncbi:MAG: ribbon-helix-helix domain-containing protein [Propionibacteriaceae bacterium]|nr:ribbon-helix-helix domain-containing protein [Propionibacteriaceae bacterium]